jgi:Thiamine pyrophosphate enzyme, central domain
VTGPPGRGGVTAGQLLARAFAAAGIGAAYGRPLSGVPVTEVRDGAVAVLLAQAHRAVHGVGAVAHLGEGAVMVPGPSPRGGHVADLPTGTVVVDGPDAVRGLPPLLAASRDGVRLELRIDPSAPAGPGPLAPAAPPAGGAEPDDALVDGLARARRVVVLAGPGVVSQRAVGGLRALAAAGRLGVLNTWGAKGVFDWQSRHHWATVGLQTRDFELGGIPDADLVLAVGVDEREAPRRLWDRDADVYEVEPAALGPLAERWPGTPSAFGDMPPLRQRLAAVTQAGWAAGGTPLMPTLVTRHYAQVLGESGLVAADPGTAGYWVARTFATTRLGSALVPAAPVEGWAAACVLAARLVAPLRPALAVVDGGPGRPGPQTDAVLAEAARLGIGVGLEVWVEDDAPCDADHHLARLAGLVVGGDDGGAGTATLASDPSQLAEMVEAAGPVRAWTGDEVAPG